MEFIDLKYQYRLYQKEIDKAISDILQSGMFIMGKSIVNLEEQLAAYVNVKYCLGVSSGSDALTLALKALEVGPGDEVICVPYTWVSPVECVKNLGAKPVFVDIDPETYLMDVNQIEAAVTSKTKAIIPVSLYGQMPDFNKIKQIAEKYNLAVIEDAAQSFGAEQNAQKSCSLSIIGVTSFFPTKPLGCYGDGGAIFTNSEKLANKMYALRVHGAPERYNHQYIGQNARLDTLQAAILLAKLPFFSKELKKRAEVGRYFTEHLKDDFVTPKVIPGNTHVYAQYPLRSPNRDLLMDELKRADIPCAIYYPICIHEQPAYADLGYKKGDFPNAEKVSCEMFNIPMHPFLERNEQDLIIDVLKKSSQLQRI